MLPPQFGQNVALLSLLNKEPGKPEEKPLPDKWTKEPKTSKRQLSWAQECDLVDDLAFIVARSEEPEHVIAVCVEEHESATGMTIRLAVNRGNLVPTRKALEAIGHVLERVATRGWVSPFLFFPLTHKSRHRAKSSKRRSPRPDLKSEPQSHLLPPPLEACKTILHETREGAIHPANPTDAQ